MSAIADINKIDTHSFKEDTPCNYNTHGINDIFNHYKSFPTNQRARFVFVQSIKEMSKSEKLHMKFQKQLNKFSEYITDESRKEYNLLFRKVIDDVLSFGFPDIKVKLSLNDSFTFYLKGKSYYDLSFEVFKADVDFKIVYSLYYKDSLVSRNSGGLESVKNQIVSISRNSSSSSNSRDYSDVKEDTRNLEFEY